METLHCFLAYALSKKYEAYINDDAVIINNVCNPGNNFKIYRSTDHYAVITLRISQQDYEYMAKCMIYVLMAEYNIENSSSTHLHINFKVDL